MKRPEPNRRSFLKMAGTAGASTVVAPLILGASRPRRDEQLIIGKEAYQYECEHDWGQLPDHISWFETHGVAVDKDGFIYIKHRAGNQKPTNLSMAQDTIVVFDPDGVFVRSFGKEYHGGGHGIDIREEDGEEFLYLSCMFPVNLVVKTTKMGEVVWVKEKPEEPGVYDDPEARFSPTNVAFHPDGGFYVGDGYGSHYIHRYDKDGNWIQTWGGLGDAPGELRTPHGLWLDNRPGRRPSPSLAVADRANARLQYFTLGGEFLNIISDVSFPAHFDIRDDVLLVPDLHARVSLFDAENNLITHLGYEQSWTDEVLDGFQVRRDPSRWRPGRFVHPHDACFDADGNIFVAEWVSTGRITKLRRLS